MLKECNKFREHQAREILIDALELQLTDRQAAINELNHQIEETNTSLAELKDVERLSTDTMDEL